MYIDAKLGKELSELEIAQINYNVTAEIFNIYQRVSYQAFEAWFKCSQTYYKIRDRG